MTIRCGLCGLKFDSLIIDSQVALKDLCNAHAKHLDSKHNESIVAMRKDTATMLTLLPWYFQMTNFIDWNEDEAFIQSRYDECTDKIMETLKIAPLDEFGDPLTADAGKLDTDAQAGDQSGDPGV